MFFSLRSPLMDWIEQCRAERRYGLGVTQSFARIPRKRPAAA